jgi:hypothetical protein
MGIRNVGGNNKLQELKARYYFLFDTYGIQLLYSNDMYKEQHRDCVEAIKLMYLEINAEKVMWALFSYLMTSVLGE